MKAIEHTAASATETAEVMSRQDARLVVNHTLLVKAARDAPDFEKSSEPPTPLLLYATNFTTHVFRNVSLLLKSKAQQRYHSRINEFWPASQLVLRVQRLFSTASIKVVD